MSGLEQLEGDAVRVAEVDRIAALVFAHPVDGPFEQLQVEGLFDAPLVRSGENWRFPACYGQKGAACAGVPKPVAALEPHAAAGGVAFVRGVAHVSEWQLGKVLRVSLDGTVSTYLTGLKNPLPLLTAADGSVLVGDWGTGTVYRIAYATTR